MINTSKFLIEHNGTKVFCEISPCSWMYANYGLQVQLSLKENANNTESKFINDKNIICFDVPLPLKEANNLATGWLGANGIKPLQNSIDAWNKAKEEFDKERIIDEAKEVKRAAKMSAKRKAEGFTHLFTGWIHPACGDDYRVEAFIKGVPTNTDIANLLKKSTVKDDYKITTI